LQGLAGSQRSYLCLNLSCNYTSIELCHKEEDGEGYSTLWRIRSADTSLALAKIAWGDK